MIDACTQGRINLKSQGGGLWAPPEILTQEITFFNILQKKAFKQTRYVVFSRKNLTLIFYLENKDSLL